MELEKLEFILSDEENLIGWMAENRVFPKRNPWRATEFGKSDYTLSKKTDELPVPIVIDMLGIKNDEDCDRIRERIKNHPAWGR